MTSPHMDVGIVRRADKHSALASAAYNAGVRLYDHRLRAFHDWSHRKDVVHTEIMGPETMPHYLHDRETLWNKVEELEKRKDAQLARRIILALPHELSPGERLELLRNYVAAEFVSKGMVADIAIHKPDIEKGKDSRNHHAHILLTLRKAGRDGLYRTKTREWNSKAQVFKWRAAWADHQSRALQRAGHDITLNTRTLKPMARRPEHLAPSLHIDLIPTKHLGRGVKPGSPKWQAHEKILNQNMKTITKAKEKNERRRTRLAKHKKQLTRRLAQIRKVPGSELFDQNRTYPDKRSEIFVIKRLRLITTLDDMLFDWQVWIRGWEKAVELQRERFRGKLNTAREREKTRTRQRRRLTYM